MIKKYASIACVAVICSGQLFSAYDAAMEAKKALFDPRSVRVRSKKSIEQDIAAVNDTLAEIKRESEKHLKRNIELIQQKADERAYAALGRATADTELRRHIYEFEAQMNVAEWWRADSKMWQEKFEKLEKQLNDTIEDLKKKEASQHKK